MSEVKQLLQTLCQKGIRLWPQEGKLRYRGAEHLITPELLAQLKTHKTALLDALGEATYAPLAYGQKGLWLIQQSVPESFVYNVSFALRLHFPIDITRWHEAAQLLVNRHAALRTCFPVIDNAPTQKIDGYQSVDFTTSDATAWSEEALLAAVQAAHERPFAITTGPLFRVSIFTHAPDDHVLFVSAHHIAIDGWSIHLLIEELLLLYNALQQGTVAPLPLVEKDYRDYVMWQANLLQREGEEHWAYWKKQLGGALPVLQLPADYARPTVQSYRGVSQPFQLSATLTAQLKQTARQHNCTLYVLLLAAYEVLLHRYSGQDDILVGLTMAGRHHPEFARVIGYFTSPVVARADFSGKPTFAQFLSQVRQQVFTALEHQDYPFALLVEKLNPKRDPSRPPIFQANFVLQNFHHTQLGNTQQAAETGVKVDTIPIVLAEGQLDLSLEMMEGPQGLEGYLKGNADLFAQPSVARMVQHWQVLLESIVADPQQAVSRLPILTAAERQQILVDWNQTAAPYPKDKCMHQLFEAQVVKTPDTVALFSEATRLAGDQMAPEISLTYAQANALANQLAEQLQSLGVGVETLVGLFVERSALLFVGVLGILKAGGAYVPLDLDAPAERIALMLEDTQSPVVVTQSHLLPHLPPPTPQQRYVCLDELFPMRIGQSVDTAALPSSIAPFASAVEPQHLAYILYTSGSTGRPKGVGVEHRQVAAYGYSVIHRCQFEPGLRYAMVQPLTVDSCMTVIYPALWTGGTLHVINRNHSLDPNALAATFQRYGIDCLKIAPSHFAALRAAAPDPRLLMPRKRLVLGGEASKWAWVKELAAEGDWQVHNHYGPTETTVGVTTYRVYPDRPMVCTNTPIGYPLANTQAYILNAALEPVPVGCLGELYIGGDFVARGYLNRPDLTDERFIPDPFAPPSSDPTQPRRLYRTGDWARYLPDGAIEYLGRMDDQVKIHGLRIELGEVEAQIKQHPDVETTLVLARTDQSGEKQLVAYVVPKSQNATSLQPSTVRDFLKQKLPLQMIPVAFVMLDALPLSAHGKVDRQALPAPDEPKANQRGEFIPPQTPTEQTLAGIWAQVLKLPQVGRYDNFFEIGGDSIISLQVVSRAQAVGLQLTYRQIFEAQTIAGLAQSVEATAPQPQAVSFEPVLVTGNVPLTPIQRRFFAQPHANLHHVNQSVLIPSDRQLRTALLVKALTSLVQQHDALRLRFSPVTVGSQTMWTQRYVDMDEQLLAQIAASVHEVDLSKFATAEQQAQLTQLNATLQASLNITTGPVWQVAHVRYGADQPDRLLWIVHHLMVDWVSWSILIGDLWTIYGQLLEQEERGASAVQLPPKTTSFQTWSTFLQGYAQRAELLAEVGYWLKLADHASAPLPVDYPANVGQDTLASAKTVTCRLSATETRALLQDAPAVYHTRINDLLLAALAQSVLAWQRVLATQAGHQTLPLANTTLLLDLEHHGREALDETLDLSRTVGWFTAIFPVALQVASAEPAALIKSIKEQLRQIPRNGIGYGSLRYLNPETALLLTALPKAEITFNYGGRFQDGQATSLGGDQAANEPLGYRFRINGGVIDDQLVFGWSYSQTLYRTETVEALAQGFSTALKALLAHCLAAGAGGYTPSDFPDLQVDQAGLDRILDQIRAHIVPASVNAKLSVEALYPLSPSQQGLLFDTLAQQAQAGEAAGKYIEIYTYDIPGDLDVARFQQAWEAVLARHPALRTGFLWTGVAEPIQFVLPPAELAIAYQDWRTVAPTQQEAQWQAYLYDLNVAGFDMAKPPLMKLALFRLADQRYRFVWVAHHILKDGWGTQIILREVIALYEALTAPQVDQRASSLTLLPPAPVYQTYIRWLKQQDMARTAQFWRAQLRGFTKPTALGTPKVVMAEKLLNGADEAPAAEARFQDSVHVLAPEATTALQKLMREQHLPLNSLMQGVWAILLSRYSGDADVLFGATVSGRPAAIKDVESMVGLFINTIPIRVTIEPTQPLWDWLQQRQAQALAQDAYAFCSTGQIHGWSELPGSMPLFESILVFQNYPKVALTESHLVFEFVPTPGYSSRTQYALTIQIIAAESLLIHAVYDTWRLSQAGVAQILAHWAALLNAIMAKPEQTVGQLYAQIPVTEIPTFNLVQQTETRPAYGPPRTEQEQAVVQIWEALLGIQPIGIHDHFFALGGHSLLAMQLLARLHARFAQALPLNLLLQYPTVAALAAYLAQANGVGQDQASAATLWASLVPLQPHGSKPPLFCLPGVEGNPFYLHPLAQALGPDQPMYSLQAVGLDGVTCPPDSIEAEVAHYLTEIRRVQPQGPYYLAGHSRGGRVAYALAQQLRKEGEDVNLLAVMDSSWPGAAQVDHTSLPETALLLSFLGHMAQATAYGQRTAVQVEGTKEKLNLPPYLSEEVYVMVDALSAEERMTWLKGHLEQMQILPVGSDLAWARGLFHVYKNNLQIDALYRPTALAPVKVTLFAAQDRTGAGQRPPLDELITGWSQWGELEVHVVPGNHFSMMATPHVQYLAAQLSYKFHNSTH